MYELDEFVIERPEFAFRNLPAGADGLKIIHLSDLHVRRLLPRHVRLVETVNSEQADLVVVTGDIVSRGRRTLPLCVDLLGRLTARRGKFMVPGNWEHGQLYAGPKLEDAAARSGFELLVNRAVAVQCGNDRVYVVGVDDLVRGRPDLNAAFAGVPEGSFRIVLEHEPAIAYRFGFGDSPPEGLRPTPHGADLILSGHTHGGQVCIPRLWKCFLPQKTGEFWSGPFRHAGSVLYVNRGFGAVGILPLRFRCPAEVAVITVRRGEGM